VSTTKPSYQPRQSLAETRANGFRLLDQESPTIGKACLLQIYPATTGSELVRLRSERTLIGREPSCDVPLDDHSVSRMHAAIDSLENGYQLVDLNSTNGTYVDDAIVESPVELTGGELIRTGNVILKFMSALDQEAQYHAVVHELMTRDSLTNTFNRSYIIPLISKELAACRRRTRTLSIILLDIDHFKSINDRFGHLVGDEVLRIFCERIRQGLQRGDLLARFGGEEFLILLRQTSVSDAVHVAERVRLAISSAPFQTQGGPLSVTCSMGVACSDGFVHDSCDSLLSAADALLYEAKNKGRNCVLASKTHDVGSRQDTDPPKSARKPE
jgi:diguanylate cyclase (GGDEF)-like protein